MLPPRCAVCESACAEGEAVCRRCESALGACRPARLAVPALDAALAAAPYEGPARDLVRALKFGGRTVLAARAAQAIAGTLTSLPSGSCVVPVPPAPSRLRRRGFDPADAIAQALAAELALRFEPCLARADGPRQVGRRRQARISDPPRVRLVAEAPERAVVVDDVLTTGATLGACGRTLRHGGSREVVGVAYARTLGGLGESDIEA